MYIYIYTHVACCGAFCLDVRTLTFCQLLGFPNRPPKVKLFAGEQKPTEYIYMSLLSAPPFQESPARSSSRHNPLSRAGGLTALHWAASGSAEVCRKLRVLRSSALP